MENEIKIGTRVRHKGHGEFGIVEEIRPDGQPLVRWDYGNLLQCSVHNLEVINLGD